MHIHWVVLLRLPDHPLLEAKEEMAETEERQEEVALEQMATEQTEASEALARAP